MDYIDRWYYIDSIDASNLDTSQTKDMSYAFYGCCFMRDWEFHQNFDTSSATNMAYMFYGCDGFREVDFSNFRTSNVKTMAHMFDGSSLHRIDMSQWDISNVTDMSWMFSNDTGLSFVKGPKRVSGKTDGVDMSRMFSGCGSISPSSTIEALLPKWITCSMALAADTRLAKSNLVKTLAGMEMTPMKPPVCQDQIKTLLE